MTKSAGMRYTVLESENCEDGKQYPKGGCQERTRLLEAFVKPSGKSSRSTEAEQSVSFGGIPSVIGAGAADAPMSAGTVSPNSGGTADPCPP